MDCTPIIRGKWRWLHFSIIPSRSHTLVPCTSLSLNSGRKHRMPSNGILLFFLHMRSEMRIRKTFPFLRGIFRDFFFCHVRLVSPRIKGPTHYGGCIPLQLLASPLHCSIVRFLSFSPSDTLTIACPAGNVPVGMQTNPVSPSHSLATTRFFRPVQVSCHS